MSGFLAGLVPLETEGFEAPGVHSFDVPPLFMHGEDDQIVPMETTARKAARLVPGIGEIYYPGAPHGLTATLQDQVNADLLSFLRM